MQSLALTDETDLDAWRGLARACLSRNLAPGSVTFRVGNQQAGLFDASPSKARVGPRQEGEAASIRFAVPRAFMTLAADVILHRDETRFDLLYRLLWRLQQDRTLLNIESDTDVRAARDLAKAVSRASHKMKAFVRFRQAEDAQGPHWVAWFEPAHRVLERTAPFFQRRFTTMRWSILTPDGTAHWDGQALTFGPGAQRDQAPQSDDVEAFWQTYYASTFNPARLKTRTMQREMPKRYWANLPEAALIPDLIAAAEDRTAAMITAGATGANPKLLRASAPQKPRHSDDGPAPESLADLAQALQGCRRCPLWRDTTQAVCGQGPDRARLMIVGEQPGDQEDLAGQPFIGPAGQVLDEALIEAGLNRSETWVTNAVKHFKHEPRGKRRLHKTPAPEEVDICGQWLAIERQLLRPPFIVTLGVTAACAVLGHTVRLSDIRGRLMPLPDGTQLLATVHPAYLLRLPDKAERDAERARFVADLQQVALAMAAAGPGASVAIDRIAGQHGLPR